MALPKLTIRLFTPRQQGGTCTGAGSLTIPLSDVHALAEWLLGQPGEFDSYGQQNVVKLQAFEYQNQSKAGNSYRTVQLKESSGPPVNGAGGFTAAAAEQAGQGSSFSPEEIPF